MNSDYESNSQETAFWDRLIAANGQATEVREQVPYQPVIYAIPEEWREEEVEMLRTAVEFQPTLYRMIGKLATRQELQQMQEEYLYTIRMDQQEHLRSIRSTLQQDGSVREQNFSRTSDLLSENRTDILQLVQRLENRIKKIVICTAVSSVTLSVLVCMALQHWVG